MDENKANRNFRVVVIVLAVAAILLFLYGCAMPRTEAQTGMQAYRSVVVLDKEDSYASAVAIEHDGEYTLFLSANHTWREEMWVLFAGEKYPAQRVRFDEEKDLMLLRAKGRFPLAVLAKKEPEMFERVWAIGNGLDTSPFVTAGVVSRPNAVLPDGGVFLRVDATVVSGMSGGGVFNERFELIGIVKGRFLSPLAATPFGVIASPLPTMGYAVRLFDIREFLG